MTPESLQSKADELHAQLDEVIYGFCDRNPTIPAQVLMIGIGMLAVQLSLSHVGLNATLKYLRELEVAAKKHAPSLQ